MGDPECGWFPFTAIADSEKGDASMKSGSILAIAALIGAPIALALVSASAQQGSPRPFLPNQNPTPAGDIPPPWEIEFSLQDVARSTSGGANVVRTTNYKGMKYSVRALPRMTVDPGHLIAGEFRQVTDAVSPKSHGDQVLFGPPSATKKLPVPPWAAAGERELLLGRRIVEPTKCHGLLNVKTQGSANRPSNGKPDSFALSGNLQWTPTNWSSTVYEPGPKRTTTVPPMEDGGPVDVLPEFEVPYDFRLLTNNNNGAAYTLPSYPMGGGFRPVKRTVNFTITRKPMSIQYGDPQRSLIGQLANCKVCKDQYANPNYATGEESGILEVDAPPLKKGDRWTVRHRFIHGNVDLRLMIDGKDVTNFKMIEQGKTYEFSLVRLRRSWRWPLDENGKLILDKNGKVVGGLSPLSRTDNTRRFDNHWFDDKPTLGNLKDMPGSFQKKPPAEWASERTTEEFLVAVKDFPEFGFIYYAITFETRPGQLRFGQSQNAKQLHAEEWCERMTKPSSQPFEQPSFGQWVTRFIEWAP
jgi:hypothetical protein